VCVCVCVRVCSRPRLQGSLIGPSSLCPAPPLWMWLISPTLPRLLFIYTTYSRCARPASLVHIPHPVGIQTPALYADYFKHDWALLTNVHNTYCTPENSFVCRMCRLLE
jgi:hypothetical protein